MALSPGTWLNHYEVLGHLGTGGMGEVYRARDNKLQREVALKVLPKAFAQDPERLARFRREAQVLAQVNHPNIAAIYSVEESGGTHFLVMELAQGETLRDRIKRGPVPIEEALDIAKQIAAGLEAAHEKPIVHRDLKPANVKVTPDGVVKILDFGLARAFAGDSSTSDPANSPTLTGMTQTGVILGTAAYMSPEQARGKTVDKRTDIWALGCVLFEMLTGKHAFAGEDVTDILASVVKSEPDWQALPAATPQGVLALLRRCLEKDCKRRLRDAADLQIQIEEAITAPAMELPVVTKVPSPIPLWRRAMPWATAAVAILIALVALALPIFRSAPSDAPVQFTIPPPKDAAFFDFPSFLTISPDGTKLAVQVVDSSGKTQLWIRSLDSLEAHPIPGTENPTQQFWSPDSRFLAFYADGKLKKIAITGGLPQVLAEQATGNTARGTGTAGNGTWNRDGVILFGSGSQGTIQRISGAGGPATPVTTLDASRQENAHIWPYFLPDGRRFLYFAQSTNPENNAVYVASLDSNERTLLLNITSNVVYSRAGFLLYHTQGTLIAQPFDADRAELAGEPFPIAENLLYNNQSGKAAFAASENGVLVYRSGGDVSQQFTWMARDGKKLGTVGEPGRFANFDLSPDERRVAVEHIDLGGRAENEIWLLELSRGISTRFSFDPGNHTDPIWSPDGQQIAFNVIKDGKPGIYRKMLNGTGEEELLFESEDRKWPEDWTSDGQFIVYGWPLPTTNLGVLPLAGDRQPRPLLETPFRKDEPHVSPDGRWLAYFSAELGRPEIFVQPFQGQGEKLRISPDGGSQPRWRKDGRELFYLALNGTMMAVPLRSSGATLEPGLPQELFQTGLDVSSSIDQYAVTADGQRFLVSLPLADQADAPITVMLNWFAGLRQRVPVN